MGFIDLLKTPFGIAGLAGALGLAGGATILVVNVGPGGIGGAFPMKFEVKAEIENRKPDGTPFQNARPPHRVSFTCDLTVDYTCEKYYELGKILIRLHAADRSKVEVYATRIVLLDTQEAKITGVNWGELSKGVRVARSNQGGWFATVQSRLPENKS